MACITDILRESLCAYYADDMPQFKTIVAFDCRGVEPTDFEPRVCYCHTALCLKQVSTFKLSVTL